VADARVIPIHQPDAGRCAARTADDRACRNRAGESGYCARHEPDAGSRSRHPAKPAEPNAIQRWLEDSLAFMRRRLTGDYHIDDMGFDQDLTERVLMPILRPLYRSWWRVEQIGVENIPADGPVLLVSNHSGTLPLDALMMKLGVLEETGRHVRLLAADLALQMPVVGELARKSGNTLACEEDALRLLRRNGERGENERQRQDKNCGPTGGSSDHGAPPSKTMLAVRILKGKCFPHPHRVTCARGSP